MNCFPEKGSDWFLEQRRWPVVGKKKKKKKKSGRHTHVPGSSPALFETSSPGLGESPSDNVGWLRCFAGHTWMLGSPRARLVSQRPVWEPSPSGRPHHTFTSKPGGGKPIIFGAQVPSRAVVGALPGFSSNVLFFVGPWQFPSFGKSAGRLI